jgi:rhodanese-related sulfurtransferase
MNARVILSILVIVLGGMAAILPDAQNNSLELNEKQLHQELLNESHYIAIDELVDLLVNQDPSVQLIDLRSPEDFSKDALPGAMNIPFDSILSENYVYFLDQTAVRNILYSGTAKEATEGWMITRQKGFRNNYVLKGGLNQWKKDILNPEYPGSSASEEEFELYEKRSAARQYFTGSETTRKPKNITPLIPIQRKTKKKVQGGCS